MCSNHSHGCLARRELLKAAGLAAAGLAIPQHAWSQTATQPAQAGKGIASVRLAFLYPPSEQLKKEGYYSWPGSGFDAEGHHRQYVEQITKIAKELGIRLIVEKAALSAPASIDRFIAEAKADKPDGLLLVAFKKSEWSSINRIIDATKIPTIAMATIGVLLMPHIKQMQAKPGVHTISSLDNFDAIRDGLSMIRTRRWMRDAVILSIANQKMAIERVPLLETRIKFAPMKQFVQAYKDVPADGDAAKIARSWLSDARQRREPSEADVAEAARASVALQRIVRDENADAVMMTCLDGIQQHLIPPPCMAFMDMRDAGTVAGCQNDLDATLTMMLGQQLLGLPGFQHNPSCDTEKNLYCGSHCTSPRKLIGPTGPAQSYILRNHAEAGVGVAPQVLWPKDTAVTIAQFVTSEKPHMFIYSGKVVDNYDTPPAGGCRTNLVTTIDDVPVCEVKAERMGHATMFVGNHAGRLRAFCRMFGITART